MCAFAMILVAAFGLASRTRSEHKHPIRILCYVIIADVRVNLAFLFFGSNKISRESGNNGGCYTPKQFSSHAQPNLSGMVKEGSFNPYGNGQPKGKNGKKNNGKMEKQINDLKNTMKGIAKNVANAAKPVVKQGLLSSGRALGSFAGSQIGMPVLGATIGEKVFSKISKAIGSGDYAIMGASTNSLISGNIKHKDDAFHFVHREYITDIVSAGTGAFNLRAYDCNPGLSTVFPYLAPIASQFEEFRINGMIFEFVSTSSNYAANTALGTLIMSAEYNSTATPYSTKVSMENSNNALAERPDKNMMFGIECNEFAQSKYYVITSNTASTPQNLTTPCTFYFGDVLPSNIVAGTVLGELWVSYDISFFKPRPSQSIGTNFTHLRGVYSSVEASASSATLNLSKGSQSLVSLSNGYGVWTNSGIQITGNINDVFILTVTCRANASALSALTVFLHGSNLPSLTQVSGTIAQANFWGSTDPLSAINQSVLRCTYTGTSNTSLYSTLQVCYKFTKSGVVVINPWGTAPNTVFTYSSGTGTTTTLDNIYTDIQVYKVGSNSDSTLL